MKLATTKNANLNYLAKIVKIENFTPHPDPETTRLKIAHIDGFNLVVGIDSQPGIYVYFPTSCEINPQLLAYGNLYKHSEKNNHPENKPGFFEDNGRVKAIRLRGIVSEGFLMEWNLFNNFLVDNLNKTIEPEINKEFDCIKEDNKKVWICKKYIVKTSIPQLKGISRYQKRVKKFNRVIDTQFRFHYETSIYRKVPTFIQPNDLISVSSKIHGTSHISAYVLCKRPTKWWKFWDKVDTVYDYLYSSRSVIKNANYNPTKKQGYYVCDV